MSVIEQKLTSLGITLPAVAKPLAAYVPAVRAGNFIYTSGQLPSTDGNLIPNGGKGKVGGSVTKEEAQAAARVCALNALAAIRSVVGDLDNIERIVKLVVFVASENGFTEQPFVGNGASEFFRDVFGEKGEHARSAVGVAELPRDASVEVEVIALMKS
jgi:enamine deaminase RidA (YjgF/YER057c/UK114 family)